MMRRMVTAVAALSLLLPAIGCDVQARKEIAAEKGATEQGPPPPAKIAQSCKPQGRALKIGIVPINLQALFFNQINTGAKTVANKAGAQVQIVNGNDDSATQANAIDDLVANRFDAIIVDAIDTEGIKPAIRRAQAAGVAVVAVDATVKDPAVSTQVGTANSQGGQQLAASLLKATGGKGDIGVVAALNSTIQNERQKGFSDAVTAAGMKIKTVVDGRNIQENAQTAAENMLTGNPDLPYAYATGEPALIGLAAAVSSQQRTKDIKVVGWDLSTQAVDGLRAGWIVGVVQQNTFQFGYEAMNAAIDLSCDRAAPKDVPVPTQIVTPANVKDYLYYLEK
ncbi:substrate-binding domain-containing protein [Actinomadura barringtoniae]|uniref:Substrate-binding domain-containing protein n=1 Tax=Actinomadura barringtoniae TaxID=1427535 RepID=A0A939T998_9ACTN|nr:substrate-binding domain-containing protein [Actinomadura barringtoniae]MBO2447760.1 substrate-binding domain-containing protein [Actinomadura barringtoniae]